MGTVNQIIRKISEGKPLTEAEAYHAIAEIMAGETQPIDIAAFLMGLRVRGETVAEMTGGVKSMRDVAVRIHPDVDFLVDPVGTGGDQTGTINISSSAALVAAAAGAKVAKHGNRSVSSKSGSADFYEALGLDITLTPDEVKSCIETYGFGFMFAPTFHPAMRHAGPIRRQLGIRTLFNILGPLSNPAGAKGQVVGVHDAAIMPFVAETMKAIGVEHAMIVHGSDHTDEITITGETAVVELKNGDIKTYLVKPQDFGLPTAPLEAIKGDSPADNVRIIQAAFDGQQGPVRDVILINAAATIYVGQKAATLQDAYVLAAQAIDSGAVNQLIAKLRTVRHNPQLPHESEIKI
ncbi:MAG: anthranilate phosphoribosyltransferase [Eubacteriales bacterium]|nr:anthranilate phosphoribosyltransferase [Eubacteriales bacterium]